MGDANNQATAVVDNGRDDEIDLMELVGSIWEGKWLIIACAFLASLIGVAYAVFSTPTYQSNVIVQVEDNNGGMGGLEDLADFMGSEPAAVTEIEVLRSRHVVGRVVDRKKLVISVAPKLPPLVGNIVKKFQPIRVEGADKWASLLKVDRLDLGRGLIGKPILLTLVDEKTYRLSLAGEALGSGTINGAFSATELGASYGVDIFVASSVAVPGTEFVVSKKPWPKAVAQLQSQLSISEKGKKTGIINVSLEGSNPYQIRDLLDDLANVYVQQNVERKSAEAEKSLQFLDEQLPALRRELEIAEVALNEFMQAQKSVDLSAEAQTIISQLVALEQKQSELDFKRAELEQQFGTQHPSMMVLRDQAKRLGEQKARLEKQVESLPDAQQQALRLARDVEVNGALYTYLLNKSQELRVIKAGTVGNVRILDSAVLPYQPIKPKKALIVALAIVLGGFIGVGIVLLRRAMNRSLETPAEIETKLGLPIYATIPHSDTEAGFTRMKKRGAGKSVLAQQDGKDLAVEALRSLRTSLHFALMESENNRIAISGPSPGIGKSFISVNLAWLLAETGKRVVLIDADMRKGHIHEYFGLQRDGGLSDLVAGNVSLADACNQIDAQQNLSVITTGKIPPNPSELLMAAEFAGYLDQLSEQFDIVVVDTPPIMAVADAGIITPLVGATFMVTRAGISSLPEVDEANKRLAKDGGKVAGVLFNGMERKASAYKYGAYKYYQYEYK